MKVTTAHSLSDIFLSKVEQGDGCWFWKGCLDVEGYGRVQFNRRTLKAHRVSYELFCGPITKGMSVCHRCDNPTCVRPHHLFLGTTADNLEDRDNKGRGPVGERNGRSKINREIAEEIRRLYDTGQHTQNSLAARFGIGQSQVGLILRGKCWK